MKDRLNSLNIALNNEMRERDYYLKNAERTKNPLGKAMFKQIADEELEHYERLKQLHEKWTKQQAWPETLPLQVNKTLVKDVLKDLVKEIDKMPEGDADDLAAIKTAIEFEAKGEAFYASLRDGSINEKERSFFALLASIEHEHFLSLKETEEFFLDPSSWYRKRESSGLDGA